MPLIVETGAVVAGANSYVSQAEADSYHADRGNTAWSDATDAQKLAAILASMSFIDGRYRPRWKGYRVLPTIQTLEWPRVLVSIDGYITTLPAAVGCYLPSNVIPQRLKDAVCSLALRALSGPLTPDQDGALSKEKIDVIEFEYGKGHKGAVLYPEIDQLLSDYLKPLNNCDAVRG